MKINSKILYAVIVFLIVVIGVNFYFITNRVTKSAKSTVPLLNKFSTSVTKSGLVLPAQEDNKLKTESNISSEPSDLSEATSSVSSVLKSAFFFRDKTADDIAVGVLNNYSINEFDLDFSNPTNSGKTDTFAFKIVSALTQLGYSGEERSINNESVFRPALRLLNRFQKNNELPENEFITSELIKKIDNLIFIREKKEIPIAKKLPIYKDFAEAPKNWPTREHLAYVWHKTINSLPDFLRLKTRDHFIRFYSFYYPRYDYSLHSSLPFPLVDRFYYSYSGNNLQTELGFMPFSDIYNVSVLLHEYGHFVEDERPFGVNMDGFYKISWELSGDFWKPKNNTNFSKDFVSGYAGADNYSIKDSEYSSYSYQREDFADSFSLYVMQGKVFRDLALSSPIIQEKYNWLKKHIFQNIEYETGSSNWATDSTFSPVLNTERIAGNVQYYSSQDPNFIWDYEFPIK